MPPADEALTHAVVFDVNVYLDAADFVGPPFNWAKLAQAAVKHGKDPVPHPTDQRVDSLRALVLSSTGRLAGPEPLEVWTSAQIDALVVRKASQPANRSLPPEDRGLGWTPEQAYDLQYDLVVELAYMKTDGGTAGDVRIPVGNPPLSHEDGIVLATAHEAGDEPVVRYCVTQDRHFRNSHAQLPDGVEVMRPHEWIEFVRRARRVHAMSVIVRMAP